MSDVIIFVEQRGGHTRKVTFELATEARKVADMLGGKAHAVVLGGGAPALAEQLKGYPLDVVHVNEDADVDTYLAEPEVDYVEALARELGPSIVLVPNTMHGRDIGSRVAARLKTGIAADVTDLKVEDGRLVCVAPKLGGAFITSSAFKNTEYGVVTVRPNAFAAAAGGAGATVQPIAKPAGKTYVVKIESHVEEAAAEIGLEEAAVIISGGRGLGSAEPFDSVLKPLAQAFGGAVGATRAVADAGWVPYSMQIGQTGKTVSPRLYIAFGISGAIQHKVGMSTSGTIVAVNTDSGAPIGEFADLLVAANALEVAKELTKLVEAHRSA
jgi:electron transfer flavoprotein alpha subunit